MKTQRKVATWLELAAWPEWHHREETIRVHSLGGSEDGCKVISVDGRWLCDGTGQLTIFDSFEATERFLALLHIFDFEVGDEAVGACDCGGGRKCFSTYRREVLQACSGGKQLCTTIQTVLPVKSTRSSPRRALAT